MNSPDIPKFIWAKRRQRLPDGKTFVSYYQLPENNSHLSAKKRLLEGLTAAFELNAITHRGVHELAALEMYDRAMASISRGDWTKAMIEAGAMRGTGLKFFASVADDIFDRVHNEVRACRNIRLVTTKRLPSAKRGTIALLLNP